MNGHFSFHEAFDNFLVHLPHEFLKPYRAGYCFFCQELFPFVFLEYPVFASFLQFEVYTKYCILLEFLPENDRVRYTISNDTRRIILRELLALNHKRHAEEVAAGLVDETGKVIKKKDKASTEPKKGGRKKTDEGQGQLF